MANFADLVKANRSQGKGVIGSLGNAIGKTTLEKVDPRNYLFNRSGVLTALFPSLKGYQAKATTEKISSTTTGGGGFSSGQVELISDKLDQISTQNSIVAKNSMVLPMMHRDINVMRQSMIKMVKIWGGNQRDKADKFFMDSKTREAAYETKFGKKPTPVAQPGKEPEKEGFFSKLLGSLGNGIMPLLVKGGLAVMVAGAIKTYFNDPEFKKTIDDGVKTIFSSIWSIMKEHWDVTLGALALLFPQATLTLIGQGLNLLATIITGGSAGGGLLSALASLTKAIISPAGGVVAALAYLAYKITDWADTADINNPGSNPIANVGAKGKEFADWANKASGYDDEIQKRRDNIAKGLHADGTPYKEGELTTSGPSLEKTIEQYEKLLSNAKTDAERSSIETALQGLYKMPGAPQRKTPEQKTNAPSRVGSTPKTTAPSPAKSAPSTSSAPSRQNGVSGTVQEVMEFFKSKGWTTEQSAGIVGNLVAESNLNPHGPAGDNGKAYGIAQWHADRQQLFKRIMGKDIRDSSLQEQLEFVDWELKNSEKRAGDALRMASSASEASAIVDKMYERSTGLAARERESNAVAIAGGSNLGSKIGGASAALASNQRSFTNNQYNTTNNYSNGQQQGGNTTNISVAEVMDSDLMKELFRKRIVSYS